MLKRYLKHSLYARASFLYERMRVHELAHVHYVTQQHPCIYSAVINWQSCCSHEIRELMEMYKHYTAAHDRPARNLVI